MSSPAFKFNFVAMSSYDHFSFLQHIRSSGFPSVNSSVVLPSAEGSQRRAIFMRKTFRLSWRSCRAQARPKRYCSRSSLLRISMEGYHSQTLIRVSGAAVGRSLTRTRELHQLMLKVF